MRKDEASCLNQGVQEGYLKKVVFELVLSLVKEKDGASGNSNCKM